MSGHDHIVVFGDDVPLAERVAGIISGAIDPIDNGIDPESTAREIAAAVRAWLLDPSTLGAIDDELFLNGQQDTARTAAIAVGALVSRLTGECAACAKAEAERRYADDLAKEGA